MLCLSTEITNSEYHCDHGLDLEFRTLSANLTESTVWFEGFFFFSSFLLQGHCEHWMCVNRRLHFCRGVVARLSGATVK